MGWTSAETLLDRTDERNDPTPRGVFDRRTLDREVLTEKRAVSGQKLSARGTYRRRSRRAGRA